MDAAPPPPSPPPSLLEDLPAPVAQARLVTELPAGRVLASGQRGISDAVVAGASVVFASESEGAIVRVPLAGGRFETLARGQASPARLAARAGFVYWLARGVVAEGHASGGTVMRVALAGGTPQIMATGLDDAVDFALDGEAIIVATRHQLLRFASATAPGVVLAGDLAEVTALAVTPDAYFVATQGDATLWRVARQAGTPRVPFVQEVEHVVDLVVEGASLVWVAQGATAGEGQVATRPLRGGATVATTVLADALDRPRAAAVAPGGRLGWLGEGPDGREGSRWASLYVRGKDGRSEARLSTPHGARRLIATPEGWLLAGPSEILFVPFAPARRTRAYAPVAPAPGQPRALAVDAQAIYWISYQGAVMKVARTGGKPILLAHAPRGLSSMVLDGDRLVYVSYDAGTVSRVEVSGASGAVDLATRRPHPIAAAARAGEVYFVDDDGLEAVAASGGPVRHLAALGGTPRGLAVDDEAAFVLVSGGPGGDRLVRVALAGGTPETLFEGLAAAEQVVVDGEWVYVLDEEPDGDFPNARGQIWRTARRGAGREREWLAAGLMSPSGLAVDGGYVWFASGDGRVGRVPVAGGSIETVAGGGRNVGALCPEGGDLLVASGGTLEGDWKDGAILRLRLGLSGRSQK